jgi:hypothetical protein
MCIELNIKAKSQLESSAYCPQWPTKSVVLEELPIRETLMMLLGEEGRRKMENRAKTNQLFDDYYHLITSTHTLSLSMKQNGF